MTNLSPGISSRMLVVRSVQTLAEWQALKPVWQALVNADSRATLCNTWEWNDAWVQQFWQAHFELHVLIVERRSEGTLAPVALLPLYLNRQTTDVMMVGTGEPEQSEVASEYLDLLFDDATGRLQEVSALLLRELQRLRCRTIRVTNCLQGSRVLSIMAALPRCEQRVVGRQYGIALSQSLQELMQRFSYRQRKNGQLLLNRFDKNPAFTFEVLVDASAGNVIWQQLQQLHQADWTSRHEAGVFANSDFIRFHELLQRNGGAVRAKFSVLRHEEEVLAVHYYYQFGHTVCYYQSGTVKDRFQQYSPGKMLHMLAFRQLAGSGLYYDFMKGAVQGSYKAAMCPQGELFYNLAVYQGTLSGILGWLTARVKAVLKQWRREKVEKPEEKALEPPAG